MVRIAVAALFVFASAAALGQERVKVATAAGRCAEAQIALRGLACARVAYMEFVDSRRVAFMFPLPTGSVTFSGGRSIQPELERFILQVDAVNNGRERQGASGTCEANVSKDGRYMRRVVCRVSSEGVPFVFDFLSDGSAVSRTTL